MGERSGSLENGGFDTGIFLPGDIFSLKFRDSNFIKVASQSVFICEDDHMLYDFEHLGAVVSEYWTWFSFEASLVFSLNFKTFISLRHSQWLSALRRINMDLSSRSKSRFFDSGIDLRRKGTFKNFYKELFELR